MRVVVPFAADAPKTRLSAVLSDEERADLARAMLADVIDAVLATGRSPIVLSTTALELDADAAIDVVVDERPLTPAVNAVLREGVPVAVVMADLALATPAALSRLFAAPGDLAIAPGRAGGTNAFVARHPEFRVDYHGTSFLDHLRIARDVGATVATVDSHRLATDIDEPSDLVELHVHGEGRARDWLVDAGFELVDRDGRIEIARD